jgi:hypothetical protein
MSLYFLIWFLVWPIAKETMVQVLPWIFRHDLAKLAEIQNMGGGVYWVLGAFWPFFILAFLWDLIVSSFNSNN